MKLGLIGERLGHSQSPAIHKRIFELLGIDGQYDLIEVERGGVEKALEELKQQGYAGVNVTIPYKRDVMLWLDDVAGEAQVIGAVNTIHMTSRGNFGYNTDYYGFGRSLDHAGVAVEGKSCVVLGTGGAARAILKCLADKKAAKLTVVSRKITEAADFKAFADSLHIGMIGYDELSDDGGDVLVNCTPVGMYPDVGGAPLPKRSVLHYEAIVDIIYNPKKTKLLEYGERNGAKIVNGMYMLVAQAVGAEEIWQGRAIDSAVIEAIAAEMERQYERR